MKRHYVSQNMYERKCSFITKNYSLRWHKNSPFKGLLGMFSEVQYVVLGTSYFLVRTTSAPIYHRVTFSYIRLCWDESIKEYSPILLYGVLSYFMAIYKHADILRYLISFIFTLLQISSVYAGLRVFCFLPRTISAPFFHLFAILWFCRLVAAICKKLYRLFQ